MTIFKSQLILILVILPCLIEAQTHDCAYDDAKKHVEYACDGSIGKHFDQRTFDVFYCHNYIPGIDRSEIKSLSFHNCLISGFNDHTLNLDKFTNLQVLNISNFGLEQLSDDIFLFTRHLERVTASHNKLRKFSFFLFDYTNEIIELDFSYNQITELEPYPFENNPKLRTLNLSYNAIDGLSDVIFSNLPGLEILDLSNNQIKVIDPDLLENNKRLTMLNLDNNPIMRLDCRFLMTLAKRHSLDIWINTLKEMQTSCTNDDTHFDLDIIISPKESTTRLHITNGKFQWILGENDFKNLHCSNNIRPMNVCQMNQEPTFYQINNFIYLNWNTILAIFIGIIIATIWLRFLFRKPDKNYDKNLSVFSIEQNLLHDKQYQKIKSQQPLSKCYDY